MQLAAAIRYADVVVAQDTYSPLPIVRSIRPDILMESASHDEAPIEEARESMGGEVIVIPYYPVQSSTDFKTTIRNAD